MDKKIQELNSAIKKSPDDIYLYFERAKCFFEMKKYEKCIQDYKHVISRDKNNATAYGWLGHVYYLIDEYDNALSALETALSIKPDYVLAYYARGNVYEKQKEYEKALNEYTEAIRINADYALAYCARGSMYEEQGKYDEALADYTSAIDKDPDYALAYYFRGSVYEKQEEYKEALADYTKSKELFTKEDMFWVRLLEGRIQEINGLLSKTSDENKKIKEIIEAIEASGIKDSIKEVKNSFNQFIKEPAKPLADNPFEFVVLRRWNSYTPIIAENSRVSKGGGYFIRLPKCGIVIDPGFNFIDNFKSEGHLFHEIDHVLITHAHNDHTTDLESILTLLHQYNETIIGDFDAPEENTIMQAVLTAEKNEVTDADRNRIEKAAKSVFAESERRKRLRIYMSASTYKKYAPMLELSQSADYDIIIVKAGDKLLIEYPNPLVTGLEGVPEITAIKAKHNDLISDRDSLGFVVKYGEFVLVYTGDTGFSAEIEKQYREVREAHRDCSIVLLAHLGGFKGYENRFDASKGLEDNQRSFYRNHLGRLGLAKLIETVKPKICLISEFGEEFKRTRLELTKIYQKVYWDITFIPADIGLRMNTECELRLIDKMDWEKYAVSTDYYDYSEARFCERYLDASLHYYREGTINEAGMREFLTHRYHQQLH